MHFYGIATSFVQKKNIMPQPCWGQWFFWSMISGWEKISFSFIPQVVDLWIKNVQTSKSSVSRSKLAGKRGIGGKAALIIIIIIAMNWRVFTSPVRLLPSGPPFWLIIEIVPPSWLFCPNFISSMREITSPSLLMIPLKNPCFLPTDCKDGNLRLDYRNENFPIWNELRLCSIKIVLLPLFFICQKYYHTPHWKSSF